MEAKILKHVRDGHLSAAEQRELADALLRVAQQLWINAALADKASPFPVRISLRSLGKRGRDLLN